ncbi:4-hydroxy-3-methylbut-2-enyl diphosphate reductase [bacterium]|nr:4-hydroxy-3-methylbut-2-enyl diphosphate reductase [bacterium]
MKQIIVAEDQGFCWGVRRALKIVAEHDDVFIFGDLIHNKQVVQQLEKEGKKIIHEITGIEKKPIVVTAHGTTLENLEQIRALGLETVDTTCPLVSTIYRIGKQLEEQGYHILIIGDKQHVEVKGIASRMRNPIIIKNEEELKNIELPEKIGVICQSTFSEKRFNEISTVIKSMGMDVKVKSTICSPTKKRQIAAEKLAKQVEIMIVVGGFHSSNTKKLAELTSTFVESHHIETADQLNSDWFKNKVKIGITSGASTADWIVEQICKEINLFE